MLVLTCARIAAIQVMQVAMMFLSALPLALSIVSSSHLLAVAGREAFARSFLHTIQFDLVILFVALFLVSTFEFRNPTFQLWPALYEVVSAYGTGNLRI